jgi:hypothetical protein
MIWLITSILGYGSVWAFDGHADEFNEHQGVVGNVDQTPDDDGGQSACDHCCHASAHIIALWPADSSTAYPGVCAGYTPYLHTLSFNTYSPPDRPPQG